MPYLFVSSATNDLFSVPPSTISLPYRPNLQTMSSNKNRATPLASFSLSGRPSTHPDRSSLARTRYLNPFTLGMYTMSTHTFCHMTDTHVGCKASSIRLPSRIWHPLQALTYLATFIARSSHQ